MVSWKKVREFLGRVRSTDVRRTHTNPEGAQLAKDLRDASGPANVYNRPGIISRHYEDGSRRSDAG